MNKLDNKKLFDISERIIDDGPDQSAAEILIPPDTTRSEEPKDVNYWRSFRELYKDPSFKKEKSMEFLPGELQKPDMSAFSKFSRRKFLALMSASAAVAASGCSNYRDRGEIVPYNSKPESITVGNPTYYASTCTGCSSACGILIKTLDGRPIKVDGNPDHPVSKGKICAIGQASVMSLYDPERLKNPVERINRVSPNDIEWKDADAKIIAELKSAAAGGKEIAIVTHTINSPSAKKLFDEFVKVYPTAKIYSYELFDDSEKSKAWEKCYGSKTLPLISWDKANIILSLESDFLGSDSSDKVETARLFTANRDAIDGKTFNRLYMVEGNASITGLNSDYRMILKTDAIEEFVMCLLNQLIVKERVSNYSNDSGITSKLQKYDMKAFAAKYNISEEVISHLVSDLKKNQGSSFVTAGSMLPESTQIAVNLLNEVIGGTALYRKDESKVTVMPLSTREELENLVSDLNSGKTGVVIHYDTNPVYHLPADLGYEEAVKKAKTIITLGESVNESSEIGSFVLPVNSMFESWGDYQTRNNFYSLQQPVIAPIYNTRQKEDILMTWISGTGDSYNADNYHKFVMDNWKTGILASAGTDSDFSRAWYTSLNDGVVMVSGKNKPTAAAVISDTTKTSTTATNTANTTTSDTTKTNTPAPIITNTPTTSIANSAFNPGAFISNADQMTAGDGFSLLLLKNGSLGDGRYANNGWLQELPKSVSRVVWDNYAAISVKSAEALGVVSNDKINITTSAGKMEIPVFVQPGMADGVIAIELGYGRKVCGTVGIDVGFNANVMMSKSPKLSKWFYNDAKVEKSDGIYEIVSVQDSYPIDEPLYKDIQYRREIIQEGTYLQYKENPNFLSDRHTRYSEEETEKLKVGSINEQYKHTGTKWGMVIDLNKCIGCNECVAACNVENNIPVVGKEESNNHRAMHWIRIDRYYSGTPEVPKASFQPMLCQHCDFAPCENVCPVAATTHSADGINGMAYNRCVGTRYCSNNCPYKVRRFNYFNFRDHFRDGIQEEESFTLMMNPEVTVRSRGVMEKCTFCLQRIMEEKQMAIQDNRQVKGSNVKTACQEACNTNAISFGDQNDKESDIFKLNNSKLAYHVLEEIKVKPNVTYLAKLRNVYEIEKEEAHH